MLNLMHKLILGGVGEGKVYFSFLKSVKKGSQSLILPPWQLCSLPYVVHYLLVISM